MSKYVDADEFLEDESVAYMRAQSEIDDEVTWLVNSAVHEKVQMLIHDAPIADVVSRDQYNTLYEENLKLREANERLKTTLHNLTDCWEDD